MQVLDLQQGSAPWLAHRAKSRNASDAAAVLSCSPYMTRSQLLHARHTGILPEVPPDQQRRFDKGHEIEAKKRPVGEAIIGEDLYPCVGTEVLSDRPLSSTDGIELSASFDGLTMLEDTNWECKSLNDELRAALPNIGPDANDAANLPKFYRVQMQQQCMVSGAKRVLFTASDGNEDDRHCWFYPDADLAREILAGWRQFDADLAAYVPPEAAEPAPVGRAPESLPALRIELSGAVTASNLAEFKATALGAIRSVNRELTSDQHFADARQAVKWCGEVEARIKAAKEHALSQTATIDELFRTLDDVSAEARRVRLDLEKLVTRRESEIKGELVSHAKAAYEAHEAACRQDAGAWILLTPPDFAAAIKGKRSVDSMRDALDAALARAKIAASEQSSKIRANLSALDEESKGFEHLFRDRLTFIGIVPEAVRLMVRQRITEHRAAEERRAAELAEQQRERIQREEQAKAEKAAREKIEAEQREALASVLESRRKANASGQNGEDAAQILAAHAPAQPVAVAPIASPAVSSPAANVVPMGTRAPAESTATIRLGEISERLAPVQITAAGLATLGFEPVGKERAAVLYRAADFQRICAKLMDHIESVAANQPLAA